MLSVRLVMQSTFSRRASAARGTSAVVEIPMSTISKPYSEAKALYSSMVDKEFTSLVVNRMPMVFASGSKVRII